MEIKKSLLVVDDEKINRQALERALYVDYKIHLAESTEQAINYLAKNDIDIVLTDVRMTGANGIELIKHIKANYPRIKSLVMTAYGSIELAVTAIREGSYDFISKPIDLNILYKVLKQLEITPTKQKEKQSLKKKNSDANFETNSPKMKKIIELVNKVAQSKATIFLSGKSGTGKEVMANYIHKISDRSNQPFIATHCASLNTNLLESELFGHKKGAFTGAINDKQGRFKQADKGTLFLDEIGEINHDIQIKLLRVLETRSFEPVGSNTPNTVDIRIITATNKNLAQMVQNNEFREDLYYRLNVINIELPALKDRAEDIIPLTKQFITNFNKQQNKKIENISPKLQTKLINQPWKGNIRELRNTIEKMCILCNGDTLNDTSLLDDIPPLEELSNNHSPLNIQKNKKKLILEALKKCDNNKSLAAEMLGMSRRTLYRQLKDFDIQ